MSTLIGEKAVFAAGEPVDHFSIRWTGYIVPKEGGIISFFTSADDGVRLYVGDEIAIDDWLLILRQWILLRGIWKVAKRYKIRLEYFESVGSAIVVSG